MTNDGDQPPDPHGTVSWSPPGEPGAPPPAVPPSAAPPGAPPSAASPSWTVPAPPAGGPPASGPPGAGPPGAWPPGAGPPGAWPPGAGPGGWPPPPPPARRGSGAAVGFGIAVVVLLCALVFLAGAIVLRAQDDDTTAAGPAAGDAPQEAAQAPPTTRADGRLAPPPVAPDTDDPFTFFTTEPDGDPVAWDPCDPIEYVVNSARAPEGAMGILDEAIARIEEATGLVFVDEGATDEMAPVGDEVRPDSDPGRYGDGWSPVLISWTDAMADPELDGAAGLALPSFREAASGEEVYVTGYVEMAGDYAADLIADGRSADVLGVMMHELGHLVGLGHVTPSDQVMTDDPNSTPSEWGDGDRAGLALVGTGECEPDL